MTRVEGGPVQVTVLGSGSGKRELLHLSSGHFVRVEFQLGLDIVIN